ncbi:pilus assembly protein TadG-related protein [Cellulomonas endophytica]|uniref:pilus assembly protein TadG-related protein n=1 Tax=Cellulomonas endophytica TaxID=2494735 RepID=UPI00196B51B6|nr:pilus assembly protein TadG-related protein [Cellulomonas endophytica]
MSVFVVIATFGLMVLIGLVVDGGTLLRATQSAHTLAGEAARAGGQAVDRPTAASGDVTVNPAAAVRAASAYLTAAGTSGTVAITGDGTRLSVTVTDTAPTVFLALIGIRELSATSTAHAVLVHALPGGTP